MLSTRFASILLSAVATSVISFTAPAAMSQSVGEFYKGKTVTVMIGHPPGGSFDLYARLAVDHLQRFIPGNPNVLLQHKPGGGGTIAVNYFYDQAPRDGSMIGLFPETIGHTQVINPKVGKWKLQEMTYIGSLTSVNAAFVRRKDAVAQTVDDMKQKEISVGCTGQTSQSYQTSAMLKNLVGLKLKIICGYQGSKEYVLAMERGEIDAVSSAWNQWAAGNADKFASGEFVAVIQTGLKRHPDLAKVPLAQDLVRDPEIKKIFQFASAGSAIGRALIAPPGVPQDRIAALREAFDKMVKDPQFVADAKKRRAALDPTPGAEVQAAAVEIVNAPKSIVEKAAAAIQ